MARSGPHATLDRAALDDALSKLDRALYGGGSKGQSLVVLGGAAMLLYGHPGRYTQDIDVWAPGSRFVKGDLARACRAAGLGFQPKEDKPLTPYLQLVVPPSVRLPPDEGWRHRSLRFMVGDRLEVRMPPPALIAASKMTRASSLDLHDVMYLIGRGLCQKTDIAREIARFPPDLQQQATENLVYLEALRDPGTRARFDQVVGQRTSHDEEELSMGAGA